MAEPLNMDKSLAPGRPARPAPTGSGSDTGAEAVTAGQAGTAGAALEGLGGSVAGRTLDLVEEDRHWQQHFASEALAQPGRVYGDHGPAYSLGRHGQQAYGGSFDDAQARLSQDWERLRAGSRLTWEQARESSRVAWQRAAAQSPWAGQAPVASAEAGAVRVGREDLLAHAEHDSGRTFSAATRASSSAPAGPVADPAQGSASAAASAAQPEGPDALTFANLPRTDSSMPVRQAPEPHANPASQTGVDAFGPQGALHSAWAGEGREQREVVDVINDLIECCRDGEYGHRLCAQHTQNSELKQLLSEQSQAHQQHASELMDCIRSLGGQIDDGGSLMGSMHRGWVSVKGALAGYSDRALLAEAQRGEEAALARYQQALDDPLPAPVRDLVQRQTESLKRKHQDMSLWQGRVQDPH